MINSLNEFITSQSAMMRIAQSPKSLRGEYKDNNKENHVSYLWIILEILKE